MPSHTPKERAKRRRKGNLGLTSKQAGVVTTLISPKRETMADSMNRSRTQRERPSLVSEGFISKVRNLRRKRKKK